MGIIGGRLGYHILRSVCKDGRYTGYMDGSAYEHRSKLETLLGPSVWDAIRDKTVVDFGCGMGDEAVEMAKRGARRVIGIDIGDYYIGRCRIGAQGGSYRQVHFREAHTREGRRDRGSRQLRAF